MAEFEHSQIDKARSDTYDCQTGAAIVAFMPTSLGALGSLAVLNTTFDDNEGETIVQILSSEDSVTQKGNSGSGNVASSCEASFDVYGCGDGTCLSFDEDFAS